ncbi:hypothetical protein FB451DRAFT_1551502 [Mycena latifolia]|nr:hypothetical protein FB451DRAFT_1551502 [Mycena latifolia]
MPTLPVELEREIFEWGPSLLTTVDLIFYESVAIPSTLNGDKFLSLLDSPKYEGFFARTVKNLCLDYDVKPDQACRMLSACTGVKVLGCRVDEERVLQPFGSLRLPRFLSQLSLQRLSIDFTHFSKIPSNPSTWLGLTHLHLEFWCDGPSFTFSELSQSLRRLPRLTHVGLSSSTSEPVYAEVIYSSCPNMQFLVVVFNTAELDPVVTPNPYYPADPRVVFIDARYKEDFETLYCGPANLWARAEEFMTQRNAALEAHARMYAKWQEHIDRCL